MNAPIFSLHSVGKTYVTGLRRRSSCVLENINLEILKGEAVGFIGHNGAGKSSTIRIMLGLQRPSVGQAFIRGVDAAFPSARRGVSYLPETTLIYDHMSPAELLLMALRLYGYTGDEQKRIGYWLERLRIGHVANKRVRSFSKGMAQRVALAMALCTEPEVLVLDEPLSGLDPIGRREIVDILDEYRQSGNTLFFSSHVLSDVERLADRFIFIHQGRIRATHSVSSILHAAADRYEVVSYCEESLEAYESAGRNLWRTTVDVSELSVCLEALKNKGALLHSVKSAASVEQVYLRLVGEANVADAQQPIPG